VQTKRKRKEARKHENVKPEHRDREWRGQTRLKWRNEYLKMQRARAGSAAEGGVRGSGDGDRCEDGARQRSEWRWSAPRLLQCSGLVHFLRYPPAKGTGIESASHRYSMTIYWVWTGNGDVCNGAETRYHVSNILVSEEYLIGISRKRGWRERRWSPFE
jgi:hypothetical protein